MSFYLDQQIYKILDHDCFYLRLRNLVKGKVKSLLELLMFSIFSLEEEELIKEMTLTTAT